MMFYVVDKQEEETCYDMASSDCASDPETGSEAEVTLQVLLLGSPAWLYQQHDGHERLRR